MSSTKNLKLARYLKVLLDILFSLSLITFIGLLVWTAVSPFVLRQADTFGTVTIPVRIGSGSEPQLEVQFDNTPAYRIDKKYLEEAQGSLVLTTTNAKPVMIVNAVKLVLLAGIGYIIYLVRAVVVRIKDGEPFAAENVTNIRRMGYMVLLMSFLSPLAQFLVAYQIMRQLPETLPSLQPGPTFDGAVILVALFILLLAQIWSYAIELERERALTI